MSKESLFEVGILAFMLHPLMLLIVSLVLIGVFLGFFAVVYITLQSYHLMTAVMFLVATLIMLYIGVKSEVITKQTTDKYPWMWVLIPGSFIFGYISENISVNLTVVPLTLASEQQAAVNYATLFILLIGVLYILVNMFSDAAKK